MTARPETSVGLVAPALAPVSGVMLESLYQHRVLTTTQLHALHTPQTGLRWTRQVLADLHHAGLVAYVRAGRGGVRLHHLTRAGCEAVELIATRTEPRRRLINAAMAAGPLQAHTLAVNDTGLAFVRAARARGDECGPLAWRHEIAHPTGPAAGARRAPMVIADALLRYLEYDHDDLVLHAALIEVDRATQPTDALAAKLARYADMHAHTPKGHTRPAWREHYERFPTILCVLTGASDRVLSRRIDTVLAILTADPRLTHTPQVHIRLARLDELTDHGPFAAIFHTPRDPGMRVDWRGAHA